LAVAVTIAVGLATWLLLRGGDGDQGTATRRATGTAALSPRLVSPAHLPSYAAAGVSIYWAGRRPGTMLEFSRRASGVFIRYLPNGAEAGEKRARLTVGSYPLRDPLAAVERAGRAKGARLTRLPDGGRMVTDRSRPTNAYFAFPGKPVQVEVYDPRPGRAAKLIRAGEIVPIEKR
jgi:hypothetical protein